MYTKKSTRTNTYYQLERKDKAGRWTPFQSVHFLNRKPILANLKEEIKYYQQVRKRRSNYYNRVALPRVRRIVKVTEVVTTVRTKKVVK